MKSFGKVIMGCATKRISARFEVEVDPTSHVAFCVVFCTLGDSVLLIRRLIRVVSCGIRGCLSLLRISITKTQNEFRPFLEEFSGADRHLPYLQIPPFSRQSVQRYGLVHFYFDNSRSRSGQRPAQYRAKCGIQNERISSNSRCFQNFGELADRTKGCLLVDKCSEQLVKKQGYEYLPIYCLFW